LTLQQEVAVALVWAAADCVPQAVQVAERAGLPQLPVTLAPEPVQVAAAENPVPVAVAVAAPLEGVPPGSPRSRWLAASAAAAAAAPHENR